MYSLDILLALFGTSPLFHTSSNCCFLTCIQVSQEVGQVVWYSHPFKNLPQFVVEAQCNVRVTEKNWIQLIPLSRRE